MGKRSSFERVERDFYRTPTDAVNPLWPFIQEEQSFCEPCAGDGALINALVAMGLTCTSAFDIAPQSINIEKQDALALDERDLGGADLIITNPPWERSVLHNMIEYFTDLGTPTWLLFDADWIHTKQSIPYMPRLRKIVSIGRIKWFDNQSGKDNACWYLFDQPDPTLTTKFYGR